jgi:hypothetical protein
MSDYRGRDIATSIHREWKRINGPQGASLRQAMMEEKRA